MYYVLLAGQVRSECLTRTFRASCCSAHLSRAQVPLSGTGKGKKRVREGRKETFYLTTHSTHFIYGYMVSDIWLRTILIVRKETRFLINSKGSFICTIPQTG